MSRGHTLLEIATVLALLGSTVAAVAPALRRHRDVSAVVAARESVVALVAEARVLAVGRGGADVRLSAGSSDASLLAGADTVRSLRIREDLGVELELGGRDEVVLSYDAVGVGRVASATVGFRRGAEERFLVVSSYGRVRRR